MDDEIDDCFALVGEVGPPEIDPGIDALADSVVEAQEHQCSEQHPLEIKDLADDDVALDEPSHIPSDDIE